KGRLRSGTPLQLRKLCDRQESSSYALLAARRYRLNPRGCGIMRVRLRHSGLYFRHRDHGQKTNEEQKERSENPERADVCPNVHPGRDKQAPGGGEKVAMQSTGDDDEALEPNASDHANAEEINEIEIPDDAPKPKKI